jgi:3,4-dihydroxy 2-butanone 4-phosphate synthase/GTP cyclohydrolase II
MTVSLISDRSDKADLPLNSIEEIIEDLRAGRMVIVMDDENRENEGDFLMAAACARPEDVNFMAKHGRGLICLTLTRERCRQLFLPLMVGDTYFSQTTSFTVSIDAAEGVTTGISAADRARTIQAAVARDARPADLVQPGHIFPLMAQPGGVLVRAGHTEAGCDLARLAGFEPAAVIVEILNEDGTMARYPDLAQIAQRFDLKIGTIADLIRFRVQHEPAVERVSDCLLPTEYGDFKLIAYQDTVQRSVHLAAVMGEIDPNEPVLVRVQVENPLVDLLGTLRAQGSWSVQAALARVAREGKGVVVVLCNQTQPSELIWQINNYKREDKQEPPLRKPGSQDLRTIGLGAQILADLGVRRMRVLSAPKRIHSLAAFGLEVVEYVS